MQSRPVDPQVKAKIQKVLLEALALGWKPEMLWETRFWNVTEAGNLTGLAAVLKPGDEIIEVTEDYIAIRTGLDNVLRFYKPKKEVSGK